MNARIDHIAEIGDQLGRGDQREQVQRAEHDRIVAPHDRLVRQQPEAVEREQRLDQQAAGEERADERGRKADDQRQHRMRNTCFPARCARSFARAVSTYCRRIWSRNAFFVSIVTTAKLPTTDAVIGSAMCLVVEHFADERQLREVVRRGAQREQLPERAAAEQHEQQHAEHEARNRIADEHDEARRDVERRAVAHRLCDAERHRYQVREEERPQPDADRHGQLLHDQRPRSGGESSFRRDRSARSA